MGTDKLLARLPALGQLVPSPLVRRCTSESEVKGRVYHSREVCIPRELAPGADERARMDVPR